MCKYHSSSDNLHCQLLPSPLLSGLGRPATDLNPNCYFLLDPTPLHTHFLTYKVETAIFNTKLLQVKVWNRLLAHSSLILCQACTK